MAETFQDRMFRGGEAVYAAIERGEVDDVEAALIQVQVDASGED